MKFFRAVAIICLLILGQKPGAMVASADSHGPIQVEAAWVRITISKRPAAVYLLINNLADQGDRLVAVKTPAAEKAELHSHVMENGMMSMRKVDSVEIPNNGTAEFKPGGNHIMLFNLADGTKTGDRLPITLVFEQAGDVHITAVVQHKKP